MCIGRLNFRVRFLQTPVTVKVCGVVFVAYEAVGLYHVAGVVVLDLEDGAGWAEAALDRPGGLRWGLALGDGEILVWGEKLALGEGGMAHEGRLALDQGGKLTLLRQRRWRYKLRNKIRHRHYLR